MYVLQEPPQVIWKSGSSQVIWFAVWVTCELVSWISWLTSDGERKKYDNVVIE